MHGSDIAKWWMVVGGGLMVVIGGLALLDSNLVGTRPDAVLTANATHGAVHLAGGLLSIGAGLMLAGRARANAALLYGAIFMMGFFLNLMSADLWGHMSVASNKADHVVHFTFALASLAAGYVARYETSTRPLYAGPPAPRAS
ncbi:MAG: hypothetical protein EPO65_13665 [Dehalococcoidia bacterium]|nr:MAG: hypothetical protein EPO65_13665 [Dehalococcoidia bacterium]